MVKYTYDEWGNKVSVTGSMATTLGLQNPFRYRGYCYDEETGWYYLQTRYYDPVTGRFLNADNQINDGVLGTNLFAYCENNPVNMVDYDGHWPTWGQVFTAVAIVVATAVVVAAVVVAAPAVAGAVFGTAAFYGASAAVCAGLATAATIGCAAVAAGIAITGANRAVEAVTGTNYGEKILGKENYDNFETAVNTAAMLITSVPQTTPYPSTGRSEPQNLKEQMSLNAAMKNPQMGNVIIKSLNDPRMPGWMGWQKYAMTTKALSGNIQVHYVGNRVIPIFFDFKISG